MKGNKVDELFRKKIGHQKVTPPAGVWDQINTNLHKKKSRGITLWVSIAASLLAIFVAGKLVLNHSSISEKEVPTAHIENTAPAEQTVAQELPKNDHTTLSEAVVTIVQSAPTRDLSNTSIAKIEHIPVMKKVVNPGLSLPKPAEATLLPRESTEVALITAIRNHTLPPLAVEPLAVLPASESFEDHFFVKRKRSRMISGIISIAKNVNKRKLGFSEMRAAKNEFVSNDLKYGGQESGETDPSVDTRLR